MNKFIYHYEIRKWERKKYYEDLVRLSERNSRESK